MSDNADYVAERRRKFEEAKKARDEAAKAKSPFSTGPIPTFERLVLEQDKCQVFRMIGESLEQRKVNSDPLMIDRSIIRSDDDTYFTCIWDQDKDWPLRVLQRKLAKYKWDATLNSGKGGRVYENDGCDLLKRWNTNGQTDNPYGTGMEPKKFVLINVIDRMDTWCKDNKHTKLLAWDSNDKDGKTYYTDGMTSGLYKFIWETKCTLIGKHFEDVDFIFRRYSKKNKPSENVNYNVYFDENKSEVNSWSKKDGVDYLSKVVSDYLSAEEAAYERYNLENVPFMSMPTPMGVIMHKLGKFIKDVDAKYGWNIYQQCIAWNEKERKLQADIKAHNEDDASYSVVHEEKNDDSGLPSAIEANHSTPVKKVPKNVAPSGGIEFTPEMLDTFEGLSSLSEDEKAKIIGVDTEEFKIDFSIDADSQCGACEKLIPDSFTTCPYCGVKY